VVVLVALLGLGGGQRALEVVQRGQQLLDDLPHPALARGRGLTGHPLAVVLEVRLRALGQREVLVALGRAHAELAEARNAGENAAYQAERQLNELGDQVDEASKTEIQEAIKAVRESLTSDDAAEIRSKTDALQASFHKVSEAMYERAQQQAQQAGNGAGADGAAAEAEEDVVDAEVVDEGR